MLLVHDIAIADVKRSLYYVENYKSVRSDEHIVHVKCIFWFINKWVSSWDYGICQMMLRLGVI